MACQAPTVLSVVKRGLAPQAFRIESSETKAPRCLSLFHVVARSKTAPGCRIKKVVFADAGKSSSLLLAYDYANGDRHDEKTVKEPITLIDVEPVPSQSPFASRFHASCSSVVTPGRCHPPSMHESGLSLG